MAGVPDLMEGGVYDPYDEQRLLEMEETEDNTEDKVELVNADDLLNSSSEEAAEMADPATTADPVSAPEPVPAPAPALVRVNTPRAPVTKATGVHTGPPDITTEPQSSGTDTRTAAVPQSSAKVSIANCTGTIASTTNSAQLPSEYIANKHCTRIRNGAPSIHDGSEQFRADTGSFFIEGDNRYVNCCLVYDEVRKANISYSFNPDTLKCQCCNYTENTHSKKTAFVLTDQNFPAALPSCVGGGACLKIIRIEGGSLPELTELFLSLFKNRKVPPGSVILLGSATYLATVGVSGYAEDFVEASLKLGKILDRTSVVAAVPIIMLDGTTDPALIRSVVEISAWFEKIFDKIAGFSVQAHRAVIECLAACGTGGVQRSYSERARLPCNRLSKAKSTWACPSLISLPEIMLPVPVEFEKKIIGLLINDLNISMALDLDTTPNQIRMVDKRVVADITFVIVGSSHARRTAKALRELGEHVTEVIVPAWRPTTAQIDNIVMKLTSATQGQNGDYIIVYELFDNCFYFAQCDDGSLTH